MKLSPSIHTRHFVLYKGRPQRLHKLVAKLEVELEDERDLRYKTQNETSKRVYELEARETSARAIMEKFVNKVDTGIARSKETYREMKAWLEE